MLRITFPNDEVALNTALSVFPGPLDPLSNQYMVPLFTEGANNSQQSTQSPQISTISIVGLQNLDDLSLMTSLLRIPFTK